MQNWVNSVLSVSNPWLLEGKHSQDTFQTPKDYTYGTGTKVELVKSIFNTSECLPESNQFSPELFSPRSNRTVKLFFLYLDSVVNFSEPCQTFQDKLRYGKIRTCFGDFSVVVCNLIYSSIRTHIMTQGGGYLY